VVAVKKVFPIRRRHRRAVVETAAGHASALVLRRRSAAAAAVVRTRLRDGEGGWAGRGEDVEIAVETRVADSGNRNFFSLPKSVNAGRGERNHIAAPHRAGTAGEILRVGAVGFVFYFWSDKSRRLVVLVSVPAGVIAAMHQKNLLVNVPHA